MAPASSSSSEEEEEDGGSFNQTAPAALLCPRCPARFANFLSKSIEKSKSVLDTTPENKKVQFCFCAIVGKFRPLFFFSTLTPISGEQSIPGKKREEGEEREKEGDDEKEEKWHGEEKYPPGFVVVVAFIFCADLLFATLLGQA